MELHEILTARRNSIGMSLGDLSKISGVPKGSVDKIMSGASKNPGITPLMAITHALGLTLDELDEKKEPAIPERMTDEETRFIDGIKKLTPANRRLFLGILALLLKEQEQNPDSPD